MLYSGQRYNMFSALVSLLLWLRCVTAQNATSASAQNATAFSLSYGYPLLAFENLANQFLQYNVTNYLYNAQQLSSPANKTVVKPNVDTLYSVVLFDLSQTDLVLHVPEIPESQFALFSFYDVFGDNFANVGAANINASGPYRLRAPVNGTFRSGVEQASNDSTDPNEYVADVYSPTYYGVLLIRWGTTTTNLDTVHHYQTATSLSTVQRTEVGSAPRLTELGVSAISPSNTSSPALQVMNLLAKYAPWCESETEQSADEVNAMLVAAGVSNGKYIMPAGVDIEATNKSVIVAATNAAIDPANNMEMNNGWSITRPGLAGNFDNGTNFAYRTAIAAAGFLMLAAPNAVYPSWTNASAQGTSASLAGGGEIYLGEDDAIVYTFSRKPPLNATGFWSLTAYQSNYLIPNGLDRYNIGDRNNLTYPDGTLVYGSNASSSDGPFQILVQAADNPPPANWTSNWLPGPPGGGNITVTMRFYEAQEEVLNGRYVYPVVTKQAAIAANGSESESVPQPFTGGSDGRPLSRDAVVIALLVCQAFIGW